MKPLLILTGYLFSLLLVSAEDLDKNLDKKPIWSPSVGDTWTYQVVVEVQEGAGVPEDVEGQKVEEVDGKMRVTYEQNTVYRGVMPMKKDGLEAHAFHVSNGAQLEEIEYMLITEDSVEAAGSKKEGKEPKDVMQLSKAIPLVHAEWKGGEGFPFMMDNVVGKQKVRLVRKFKVLGWETLETDAGKFKSLHVQVTGMNGPMEIKRNYWFAPGTGFIKEVKKYYLAEKTVFSQTRVLSKFTKAEGKK